MRMYDILEDKRYGRVLSSEQIKYFVDGITDNSIPDYQLSALLMAICINGMTPQETAELTIAMANSGVIADLSSIKGTIVDKHSSGGVGDKCTLIIGPIVSSLGVPFAKLSGRGLGHTGGTIDKLEAIKGFRTSLSSEEFIAQVNRIGLVIAGQSGDLAPADKKLYALRDVTATIQSIPLISASIMSKKIASGASKILLDVKCGNGAFMKTQEEAFELAEMMVRIGTLSGRDVAAYVTDMGQPLGNKIGNALEVEEAYDVLMNMGPSDITEICVALSAGMLELGGVASYNKAYEMAYASLSDGSALNKFREMVIAQGGSLDTNGRPILVENNVLSHSVISTKEGYVVDIITDKIGYASLILGAGREKKEDLINPAAGIIVHKKRGEYIKQGEEIATLYSGNSVKFKTAADMIVDAYHIGDFSPESTSVIIKTFKPDRMDGQ